MGGFHCSMTRRLGLRRSPRSFWLMGRGRSAFRRDPFGSRLKASYGRDPGDPVPRHSYFGYRDGGDSLIIDCGPVGPGTSPVTLIATR